MKGIREMKKTIKIIDLLNKIANGEEVPKVIEVANYQYIYDKNLKDYLDTSEKELLFKGQYKANILFYLNDEVEILDGEEKNNFTGWKMYQDGKEVMSMDCSNQDEEEFEDIEEEKEIELYKTYQEYLEDNFSVTMANIISEIEAIFNETNDKINQLIKNQKKIIQKLNKEN